MNSIILHSIINLQTFIKCCGYFNQMSIQDVATTDEELSFNVFEDRKFIDGVFSSPGKSKIYKTSYQYFSEKIHGIPKKISEYLNAFSALIKNYSEEFEETEIVISDEGRIYGELKGLSYVGTKERILPGLATWPKDYNFINFIITNVLLIILWLSLGITFSYKPYLEPEPFFALTVINTFGFIVCLIYILFWYKSHPTRLKHGYRYLFVGDTVFTILSYGIYLFYIFDGNFEDLILDGTSGLDIFLAILAFLGICILDLGVYALLIYLSNRVEPEMAASGMSVIWFRFSACTDFGNVDIVDMDPDRVLELVPHSLFFEYHLALNVKRISQVSADVIGAKATFLKLKKQIEEICKGKTI